MNSFVQAMTWLAGEGQLRSDILDVLAVLCGACLFFFILFSLQLFLAARIERRQVLRDQRLLIATRCEAREAFQEGTGQ
jgi:hypothetical protein